jgi:hypothetical protein
MTGSRDEDLGLLQAKGAYHQTEFADLVVRLVRYQTNPVSLITRCETAVLDNAEAFVTFFQEELNIVRIDRCVAADASVAHYRSHGKH